MNFKFEITIKILRNITKSNADNIKKNSIQYYQKHIKKNSPYMALYPPMFKFKH